MQQRPDKEAEKRAGAQLDPGIMATMSILQLISETSAWQGQAMSLPGSGLAFLAH